MSALTPVCRHATLGQMLHETALAHPDKPALFCGVRATRYCEFDCTSSQVGHAMIEAGIREQGAVGILGKNSDLHLEILFGAIKSGNLAVMLNWRLAVPELRAIVEDSGAAFVFYDVEFTETIEQLRRILSRPVEFLPFDGSGADNSRYLEFIAGQPQHLPAVAVSPRDPAILLYTSGTTGVPKGVPSSHFAMLWGVETALSAGERGGGPTDRDVNLLTTPLFHLAALGWSFGSLSSGATLAILPRIDMPAIVAAIARHRVTRAVVLPALMPALLESAASGIDLSSLRLICYGASPIPEPLLARMLENFGCGFLQNYGMTEISGTATRLLPQDHFPGSPHLLSCGRGCPGVSLAIVGSDGAHLPPGETGEIVLQTPSLFKGYWNQPSATAEVLRDGWYFTGDMGFLDAAGYLYLRDRKKDMIVSGGENIYPAEVESLLARHPDVVRVAVIGVPSAKWGEEVKAVVIARPGASLDAEALIAFLRPLIAGYKLPKTVDFVEELPLTPVGKVAKPLLRERYWAGFERRIH